jgi:DNA-binding MarR family transcriptional regulator
MADIIAPLKKTHDSDAVSLVELLFFAYRDFVAGPDAILEGLGFGRAHHRVLHFVGRSPGMTVAQLLEILRITKQSLSRVLKELIEKGYIVQQEGAEDRRQRLLYLSASGEALWNKLITPQLARFREAIQHMGEDDQLLYHEMLMQLISPENQGAAQEWIDKAEKNA